MWKCKYCNKHFDFVRTTDKGNHAKHCEQNPNRSNSYESLKKGSDKRYGELKVYTVVCDCCSDTFEVQEREKRFPSKEKYFCSRKCANSVGGKAKAKKYFTDDLAHYTTVAWRYHDKKCVVCDERNIVAVHHLNENHSDNRPENLIPLCPTHHQYMHSKHKYLVENYVNDYIKVKWG